MLRRILPLVLMHAMAFGAYAQAFEQGFRFLAPHTRSVRLDVEIQNNLILLPVQINGSFPLNFILDTGVRTSLLIEPLLTEMLYLPQVRPVQVRGLGSGDKIDAAMASGLRMSLPGGIEGYNLNLIILPEGAASYSGLFGKPVAGIIGYDLFRNFVVELNYFQRYIRLSAPEHFKPKGKGDIFPIELKQSKPYLRAGLVDQHGQQLEAEWLIDTGASQAISIFHDNVQPPDNALDAYIGKGLSGDLFGKIGRVSRFSIGPYAFEDVIAGYPDSTSLRWVADTRRLYTNLGADLLSRFTITFDYPHNRIFLRKNPHYRRPFEYNTSGLEVLSSGDAFNQYHVSYVRPGSPAWQAGVRAGDQLLAVSNRAASDLDMNEIQNALNRSPGQRLILRLRRDDAVFKAVFRLDAGI